MNFNQVLSSHLRNLGLITIFSFLAGCSVLPGTFEVGVVPQQDEFSATLGMEELTPVIKAFLYGTSIDRVELVSFTTTACTLADGLGGPPKCADGEAEGTLVQVLPVSSGEGSFSRPDSIDQALDFVVMGLYAIYRVPDEESLDDYSPAGEYGLIFTREMNAVPFPITIFVEDGRIVRLQHHLGIDPQEVINQLPVESILMTPNAAQDWMVENIPEEPITEFSDNGTVTGSVCFPGESIPEMTLYFQEVNRGDLAYQSLSQDQDSYSVILSPGDYIAFAYPLNSPELGGSYSQAVLCGLDADCTDHTPVQFTVKPGEETGSVDICDWYSPEDVPPNPDAPQVQKPLETVGTINGKVCFPGGHLPAMTLFIQEVTSEEISEYSISENQTSYSIDLEPGNYIAYAYVDSGGTFGGSYSDLMLCEFDENCADHSLVEFEVSSGQSLNSIDICDWYSQSSLPPDPRVTMQPLAGMVYRTKEGEYFWVEANGDSRLIHSGSKLAIPYSGPFGVYAASNDLQAIDLFTGEGYQLTNTPDLRETSYHFDVGLPEEILFSAVPAGEEVGPGYTGGLYIINMDGSNQRTIDSEHNASNFAASPDGRMIAYGAGETAFLYNWENGIEVFDPRDYGLDSPKGQAITSPSWSPRGDELAWFVYGFFNAGDTQGIGIFDLTNKLFRLIHPYQALGTDLTPPAAQWSPDEKWLVFSVFDQNPESSGVWLVNLLNPQQEFFMGTSSSNPVFGPWTNQKKILTYSRFDETLGVSRTWTFDLVTGEHQLTPLPADAQVITWW
jgi:hypothetical protein